METKLYVGNLNYTVKESDLSELFQKFGEVVSVSIVKDKFTGQAKGFAFVQMASSEGAEKALTLSGTEFMGRTLNVAEARPPKKDFGDRPSQGRPRFQRRPRY